MLPSTNFAVGCFTLVACLFIGVEYVLFGRFHRVAFIRKERIIKKFTELCRVIQTKIVAFTESAERARHAEEAEAIGEGADVDIEENQGNNSKSPKTPRVVRGDAAKGRLFLFYAFLIFIVNTIANYFMALIAVFFKALILWKGFNFDPNIKFIDQLDLTVANLGLIIRLPGIPALILYPVIIFFRMLANLQFKFDMSAVNVTCAGSSAPLELCINCFILGFLILVIEGGYQIFQRISVSVLNDSMLRTLLSREFRKRACGVEDEDAQVKGLLTQLFGSRVASAATSRLYSGGDGGEEEGKKEQKEEGEGKGEEEAKQAAVGEDKWSFFKYVRFVFCTAAIDGFSKFGKLSNQDTHTSIHKLSSIHTHTHTSIKQIFSRPLSNTSCRQSA